MDEYHGIKTLLNEALAPTIHTKGVVTQLEYQEFTLTVTFPEPQMTREELQKVFNCGDCFGKGYLTEKLAHSTGSVTQGKRIEL